MMRRFIIKLQQNIWKAYVHKNDELNSEYGQY